MIKLFSYSVKERQLFAYIDTYMTAMDNWLGENQMNDDQLVRFMLVGLFPHYRAANHTGNEFTTITYGEWNQAILQPKTIQQIKIINKYLGHPIKSVDEYLRLLHIKDVVDFTKHMFEFVVMGPFHLNKQSAD